MKSFTPRSGRYAGLVVPLALLAGCASPGPPRAPSLRLPDRVANLSAERRGSSVVVRFTTPERTTDNQPMVGPVKGTLCRAVGDGPCGPTASVPGKVTVAGAVEWVDVLPPDLAAGAPRSVAYRVQLFNVSGRSAGPSEPVFAAAGGAPHKVEGLRAEGTPDGVALRWRPDPNPMGEVLMKRETLSAGAVTAAAPKAASAPKNAGTRKGRRPGAAVNVAHPAAVKDESTVWMHVVEGPPDRDGEGMVDASAATDTAYRYTAVRSRNVTADGRKLEMRSEPSTVVTITFRDTFPPAVPQDLVAAASVVPGGDAMAVDLVWDPNTESDLAGYNVYRQSVGKDGRAVTVKLNTALVQLPAFHDATALRDVSYEYAVTAVDAKGNESAASATADVSMAH